MRHADQPPRSTPDQERRDAQRRPTAVPSDIGMSLLPGKVKDWHLQRQAMVYVRQSSPQQVLDHRESAARQYALVQRHRLGLVPGAGGSH